MVKPNGSGDASGVSVAFGGPLKALDDSGRVEGPLVVFGSEDATDLSRFRDYFTAETDFGRGIKAGVDLLYNHGLEKVGPQPNALSDRTLGDAELAVKSDPASVWMSGQLALRDDYEKKVLDAVKAGKMALSSGTASHLIRREKRPNGANKVVKWPIVEASITPIPADPRTWISGATKSLDEWASEAKCGPYYDYPDGKPDPAKMASMAVIDRLTSMLSMLAYKALGDREASVDERLAEIRARFDEHRDLIVRAVGALLTSEAADEAMADSKSLWIGAHRQALSHLKLTDHFDAVHDAASGLADRLASYAAVKSADGRTVPSNRVDGIKTLRAKLDALVAAMQPKPDHDPDDLIQRYLDVEARLYGAGYHA